APAEPGRDRRALRTSRSHASQPLVSGLAPDPALLLGGLWLRRAAALRYGSWRRYVPPRAPLASFGAEAVECGLCPALAPPQRWPLWREPQSLAALLSVPGDPEAQSAGRSEERRVGKKRRPRR